EGADLIQISFIRFLRKSRRFFVSRARNTGVKLCGRFAVISRSSKAESLSAPLRSRRSLKLRGFQQALHPEAKWSIQLRCNGTPLCARETSPGFGTVPPPTRPASEIV